MRQSMSAKSVYLAVKGVSDMRAVSSNEARTKCEESVRAELSWHFAIILPETTPEQLFSVTTGNSSANLLQFI